MKDLKKEDVEYIKEQLSEYHIKDFIGRGNRGVAFSTYDDKVLKLTLDCNEYCLAEDIFKNKVVLKLYIEIFDCKKKAIELNDSPYHLILEEMLDTYTRQDDIQEYFTALKKVWYNENFYQKKKNYISALDAIRDYFYDDEEKILAEARNSFLKICPSQIFLYDSHCNALKELTKFQKEMEIKNPKYNYHLWIDINEGNFGFAKNGIFKLFDQGFEKINPDHVLAWKKLT